MQKFNKLEVTGLVKNEIPKLYNSLLTAISQSSGTSFPTSNLQVGMMCYRTDRKMLYICTNISKSGAGTWKELVNALDGRSESFDEIDANSAISDSKGNIIHNTYVKSITYNGHTVTVTKGDGSKSTFDTADSNTKYSNMIGATTSKTGTSGLVPAPSKGSNNRYLRSDGTWSVPPDNDHNTTYGKVTQNTDGLMSAADKKKLDGIQAGATAGLPMNTIRSLICEYMGSVPPQMVPLIDRKKHGTGVIYKGDIYLKESYQNFDAILFIGTYDSGEAAIPCILPVWLLNHLMSGNILKGSVEVFTGADAYWEIYTKPNGSTNTFFKVYKENSGMSEIYGLKFSRDTQASQSVVQTGTHIKLSNGEIWLE